MSDNSKIEWTDTTWNPVRGCTKVSPGCAHCYAETFAERWRGIPGHPYEQGFDLRLVPEKLTEPLSWKKPRRVFVNSMSDLFHKDVPEEYIDRVFAAMALSPTHTFQVLTKRAERMADYVGQAYQPGRICDAAIKHFDKNLGAPEWPLPNVWLGVSVEDQKRADERIPHLLRVPAAVRFLSCEPLLGPVDLSGYFGGAYVGLPGDSVIPNYNFGIDWVIAGGESGPKSRACNLEWIRRIVDQCNAASTPVFVKQLGAEIHATDSIDPIDQFPGDVLFKQGPNRTTAIVGLKDPKGGDMSEWPEDLRVREFPTP